MSEIRTIYIGFDGENVVSSEETKKSIDEISKLECALEAEGQQLNWKVFNNPDEPRTIFQTILGDRKIRVDQHTAMADRPPMAVVSVVNNKAVRLEFYEGHDALALSFDLRSKELSGKDLPRWMEVDPQAYNPYKFLKEALGFPIPEEIIKEVDEQQKST